MTYGIGAQDPSLYNQFVANPAAGGLSTLGNSPSRRSRVYAPNELIQPSTDSSSTSEASNAALARFSAASAIASTLNGTNHVASAKAPMDRAPQPTQTSRSAALDEIHRIAQKAGFVGLSDNDIQRAYQQGASLLVDRRA
jgi:hypothetical protein